MIFLSSITRGSFSSRKTCIKHLYNFCQVKYALNVHKNLYARFMWILYAHFMYILCVWRKITHTFYASLVSAEILHILCTKFFLCAFYLTKIIFTFYARLWIPPINFMKILYVLLPSFCYYFATTLKQGEYFLGCKLIDGWNQLQESWLGLKKHYPTYII